MLTLFQAIYLHSCNDQFCQIGPTSHINYQKIFNQLKEIIFCNSDTPQYKSLFQWFNHLVFNWNTQPDVDNTGYDSGIEDVIPGVSGLQLDDGQDFDDDYQWNDNEVMVCFHVG